MCHWDINKVLRKIQCNLFFEIRVMEVGEGNMRLEGKNGKATVQLLVNPKQYISFW
jgi:hypothetical protein